MHVPLWPELAIKRQWEQAIQLPEFKDYMPDDWTDLKKTERNFFYGVLSTLNALYVESVIKDCR